MKKYFKQDKRLWWIAVGLFFIVIRFIIGSNSSFIESFYSRGLFIFIRNCFDFTITNSPIPLFYLLVIGLLFWLFYSIIKGIKSKKTFLQKLVSLFISILAIAGGIVSLFLLLWGFNYARIPIEKQLEINAKKLTKVELKAELENETQHIVSLLKNNQINWSDSLVSTQQPSVFEKEISSLVRTTLNQFKYPIPGNVRGRILKPKGILLRFSTAGVYLPWIGEGHIDAGLHPLQKPFTMAHELAHGYGFGDEGTCNFVAYIACSSSKNAYIRYSGRLGYWRYLASNYRASDRDGYKELYDGLPGKLKSDLISIRRNSLKYPDILPDLRDVAYDTYLKTQGINEGLQNYSRVILLVNAFKQKE